MTRTQLQAPSLSTGRVRGTAWPAHPAQTHRLTCEFSYAGLKTSARLAIEKAIGEKPAPIAECSPEERKTRADLACAFQARS